MLAAPYPLRADAQKGSLMLPAFVATWLIAAFFLILPTPSGATPPSQACNNQADPLGSTSPVVSAR